MEEEKKINDTQWINHNSVKFRIKKISDVMSIVWASISGFDVNFSLMIHDFLDYCEKELNVNIEVDVSWFLKGFKVRNDDVALLLREIVVYIDQWNIEPDEDDEKLSEKEWSSV